MAQKKLMRFDAIKSFTNVLQYPQGMAGKWKGFFKNNNPVELELACGKGEYTVELAKMFPQQNDAWQSGRRISGVAVEKTEESWFHLGCGTQSLWHGRFQ